MVVAAAVGQREVEDAGLVGDARQAETGESLPSSSARTKTSESRCRPTTRTAARSSVTTDIAASSIGEAQLTTTERATPNGSSGHGVAQHDYYVAS
ncbi:hypothetical protein WY02_20695 [Pseudonocardia sp. AL041005-10]|nr:hypothetical protein WY02_20695 [Pseudonocardia sp. AL041005-10]